MDSVWLNAIVLFVAAIISIFEKIYNKSNKKHIGSAQIGLILILLALSVFLSFRQNNENEQESRQSKIQINSLRQKVAESHKKEINDLKGISEFQIESLNETLNNLDKLKSDLSLQQSVIEENLKKSQEIVGRLKKQTKLSEKNISKIQILEKRLILANERLENNLLDVRKNQLSFNSAFICFSVFYPINASLNKLLAAEAHSKGDATSKVEFGKSARTGILDSEIKSIVINALPRIGLLELMSVENSDHAKFLIPGDFSGSFAQTSSVFTLSYYNNNGLDSTCLDVRIVPGKYVLDKNGHEFMTADSCIRVNYQIPIAKLSFDKRIANTIDLAKNDIALVISWKKGNSYFEKFNYFNPYIEPISRVKLKIDNNYIDLGILEWLPFNQSKEIFLNRNKYTNGLLLICNTQKGNAIWNSH